MKKCENKICTNKPTITWINSKDEKLYFCKKCFELLQKIYSYDIIVSKPFIVKVKNENI